MFAHSHIQTQAQNVAQCHLLDKADLEPGDIILRPYDFDGDKDVLFSWATKTALRLLRAKNITDVPRTSRLRLTDLLISIFDTGDFASCGIVGAIDPEFPDQKMVLDVVGGKVQSTPLDDYWCEGASIMRYCHKGMALGDMRLPHAPIISRICQLEALENEEGPKHSSNLPLLALTIWRRCGGFEMDKIKAVVKEAFSAQHASVIDLFFHLAGAKLQALLEQLAGHAAHLVQQENAVLSTELVAAAFYRNGDDDDYPLGVPAEVTAMPKSDYSRLFGPVGLRDVSRTLRELTEAVENFKMPEDLPTHSFQQFVEAKRFSGTFFMPDEFSATENTFPLGRMIG